jgi:dienelactone hydrolase
MAASIHSREKFRCADGFEMTAHVFRPQTPNRVPGTLFIYEPFGMNGEMIRVAGEIAAEGYAVWLPDLTAVAGRPLFKAGFLDPN